MNVFVKRKMMKSLSSLVLMIASVLFLSRKFVV
ncbi:hypothetical protein GECvBN5_gp140 [Salmonella phage GEC_vB_N5]|uniref:Uncharacterized protein n=1 Tax=Salmonella phage GEC_vB_N5 TaxID=2777378 RepID=A0A7S9SRY2_9CAUD|nr:hypothetical protein GECvBN5_gp140 [Salmonella phage GEC_vB_N5]